MKQLVRVLALMVALLVALAVPVLTAPPARAAGDFRFAETSIRVAEGQGIVRIVVQRTDLPVSRATVDFRTEAGTALPASDYGETSGTLTFAVGEAQAVFTVFVRDDDVAEESEHFDVRLVNPASSVVQVTIEDDDLTFHSASAADAAPSTPSAPGAVSPDPRVATPAASPRTDGRAAAVRRPQPVPRRPLPAAPRRVTVRQNPVTPFELRPAPRGSAGTGVPGEVDAGVAILAALVLARVSAEVWFRTRPRPS